MVDWTSISSVHLLAFICISVYAEVELPVLSYYPDSAVVDRDDDPYQIAFTKLGRYSPDQEGVDAESLAGNAAEKRVACLFSKYNDNIHEQSVTSSFPWDHKHCETGFSEEVYIGFGDEASIPGVLRFGKRGMPGVLRFGKRDNEKKAVPGVLRFGKRGDVPGVLRFGKRSDMPGVLRFGKRAMPGVLRFGR
ncbi:unnamed protein product [Anisakis simplex]|uniref:FMRFamide-like neuropeptide 18 (inferred by orthology to a C. elegans protein) n=1 Tax=Anisakis simplex TaxID=6269 RepID=A0A0M3K1H2_ANISI|nr:unnamed protein product [Anisakis simplex]